MNSTATRRSDGCAISGVLDKKKNRFSASTIVNSIASLRERSNGLGGGFAAYGIYPQHANEFALHIFYEDRKSRKSTEELLESSFIISSREEIPTRPPKNLSEPPLIWRYFVEPPTEGLRDLKISGKEYVARQVMEVNSSIEGAYIVSSGKNMGVFKGVGFPEDIAEFYRLDEYEGYLWTAHGRFPTNTPGWWVGAHPFSLLDWSIVHNGEVSSYDANRRYINTFGYKCTMKTDTEVITYLCDLLLRRHDMDPEGAAAVFSAPLWEKIARMDEENREYYKKLRTVYGSGLLNGPFSIILGSQNGFMILNDRIKLRPMVVAEKGDKIFASSEESGIREVCPDPDELFFPDGGEPVVGLVEGADRL